MKIPIFVTILLGITGGLTPPALAQTPPALAQAVSLKPVWEYKLEKGFFGAAPVVAGDTLFLGSSDTGMTAFDLQTGKVKWNTPIPNEILAAAAYFDGSIFFGDARGILYALDAKTGKERWRFDTKGTIDNSPNIDVTKKRVIIGSQHGSLYALEAAAGKSVWEYKTEDQLRCCPAIAGRQCFAAGCDGHLHIVNLDTGKGNAKIPLDAPTGSTPLLVGDLACFGTEGNEFLAVNGKTQKIVWRFPMKQPVRAAAVLMTGNVPPSLVIFGGMDKTVYALDVQTGKESWRFKTKGRIEGGGVIVGSRVYVPSGDSTLYIFDTVTGKKVGSAELPGKLLTTPAVAVLGKRTLMLLASDDGTLTALEIVEKP